MSEKKKKHNPKPMLREEDTTIADDQKKVERPNPFFVSANISNKSTEEEKMIQGLKSKEKSPGSNEQLFDKEFTMKELKAAMKMLKSLKWPRCHSQSDVDTPRK